MQPLARIIYFAKPKGNSLTASGYSWIFFKARPRRAAVAHLAGRKGNLLIANILNRHLANSRIFAVSTKVQANKLLRDIALKSSGAKPVSPGKSRQIQAMRRLLPQPSSGPGRPEKSLEVKNHSHTRRNHSHHENSKFLSD